MPRNRSAPTEFEVQATAFHLLKEAGYRVRGEYRLMNPHHDPARPTCASNRKSARFDLVILNDDDEMVLVIETKSNSRTYPKKMALYQEISGVPALFVANMTQALMVVEKVRGRL